MERAVREGWFTGNPFPEQGEGETISSAHVCH